MKFIEIPANPRGDGNLVRFRTYLAYLRAVDTFVGAHYKGNLVQHIWKATHTIQGGSAGKAEYMKRLLFLAWNTETIACSFYLQTADAMRINNHWKPVQVYYSLFSAGSALLYAIDGTEKPSHVGAWHSLSSMLTKYGIPPWSYSFSGTSKTLTMINFPAGASPVHQLRTGVPAANILATCIKAEHSNRIDDEFPRKKEASKRARNKTKNMPPLYKYQIDPGPTTLLHLAYRLRLKANYEGADMYHANVDDDDVVSFDKSLTSFCGNTLTVFEVLLMRKIGKVSFLKMANDFAAKVKFNLFLQERIKSYNSLK